MADRIGLGQERMVEASCLAFTAAEIGNKQWAICLDPLIGRIPWKRLLLAKQNRHFAQGPVPSPVIDGDRVYFIPYESYKGSVFDPRCSIVCLGADGTELWRQSEKYWATEGSTPLVVADTLYVASGSKDHILVAVEKTTGKLLWSTAVETNADGEFGAPCVTDISGGGRDRPGNRGDIQGKGSARYRR